MYAQSMMTSDLLPVRPEDSVGRVLAQMDELKVRHLPLVNGMEFKGLVYEDDLMGIDEEAPMAALNARPVSVDSNAHVYDLVSAIVAAEVDVMPVVQEGRFLGVVKADQVLRFLANQAGWAKPGGVIVLEVADADLSLSEMARLVESNDAKIIASTLATKDNSNLIHVTLKLNTPDIAAVVATFGRFGYQIQTVLHAPEVEQDMRDRYEAFLRYLQP
ncbi:MAG: CBS domain-containing protein [Flavobacteriales bacterium]